MFSDAKTTTSDNLSPLKLLIFFIDGACRYWLVKFDGGLISFLDVVAAWIDPLSRFG